MPEVIVKFKRTKIIELTFSRELTKEEIDKIEAGTFDPDDYQYEFQDHPDVTHKYWDGYETEFDEMEFGDCDNDTYGNDTYGCIYSNSDIDSYRQYLKEQEEFEEEAKILAKDPDYIKPHGKPLFN